MDRISRLTIDRCLLPTFCRLPADDTAGQFNALCEQFGLTVRIEHLMSRCARCNHEGYRRMTPEEASAKKRGKPISEKVMRAVTELWQCVACYKLYWWVGGHSAPYCSWRRTMQLAASHAAATASRETVSAKV